MNRYIEADKTLEYLNLMYDEQNDMDEPYNCAVLAMINHIKNKAPTIDIVRCKECKHWQTDWNPEEGVDNFHFCPMVDRSTFDDWFCADGEREGE